MVKDSKDSAPPALEVNSSTKITPTTLSALALHSSVKTKSVGAAFENVVMPTLVASLGTLSSGALSSGLAAMNTYAFAKKIGELPQAKIPGQSTGQTDLDISAPTLFASNTKPKGPTGPGQ